MDLSVKYWTFGSRQMVSDTNASLMLGTHFCKNEGEEFSDI